MGRGSALADDQSVVNRRHPLDRLSQHGGALLGIGATRAPEGQLRQAIDWMNASNARVLAIDIPTGTRT